MVRAKVALKARGVRPAKSYSKSDLVWKVDLLIEVSIRDLYRRRINQYFDIKPISTHVEEEWNEFKEVVVNAASEAPGLRKKRRNK